jgi:Mg2+ and Co2+ transporter CorA
MEIKLYRFRNGKAETVDSTTPPDQWQGKINWAELYVSDREKLPEFLSPFSSILESKEFITDPENYTIPKVENNFIIQNFIISRDDDIYQSDFLTVIILMELIIFIIPETGNLNIRQNQPVNLQDFFNDPKYLFLYSIITNILAQNITNLSKVRKKLNEMEKALLDNPDQLRSSEVMKIRNNIRFLSDIIEDQYVGLSILFSFFETKDKNEDIRKVKELLYNFKEINRLVNRLEEKAESFTTQFMLIHQEESAHKINILTILQAIFIPLTFIAGVYGMNFKYMPELDFQYSYFVILGVFVVLAGSLLIFFKKNGWFD